MEAKAQLKYIPLTPRHPQKIKCLMKPRVFGYYSLSFTNPIIGIPTSVALNTWLNSKKTKLDISGCHNCEWGEVYCHLMLLNMSQCTEQSSQQRILWPQMSISVKVETYIISFTAFPTWKPYMLILSGNSNMRPLRWPYFLVSNVPLYKSLWITPKLGGGGNPLVKITLKKKLESEIVDFEI